MKRKLNFLVIALTVLFISLSIVQFLYVYNLPSGIAHTLRMSTDQLDFKIHQNIQRLHIIDFLQLISAVMVIIAFFYVSKMNSLQLDDLSDLVDEDVFLETDDIVTQSEVVSNTPLLTDKTMGDIIKNASKGHKSIMKFGSLFCSALSHKLEASQMALYRTEGTDNAAYLSLIGAFAYHRPDTERTHYDFGEGLVGQSAKSQKTMLINHIPEEYINIVSGLGQSTPRHLFIIPLIKNGKTIGALEIASFKELLNEDRHHIIRSLDKMNSIYETYTE